MAWNYLGCEMMPRSSEAPGEKRCFKRRHRKATRQAIKAEIAAVLRREAEHDRQDEESALLEVEAALLELEYASDDFWGYNDPYVYLPADEQQVIREYHGWLEERCYATGRMTQRLDIRAA